GAVGSASGSAGSAGSAGNGGKGAGAGKGAGGSGGGTSTGSTTGGGSASGSQQNARPAPSRTTSGSPQKQTTSGGSSRPAGVSVKGFASGRCIDVTGAGGDGTPLQIWDCTGARQQTWRFMSDGTVRSLGMCMDVAWGSTRNGAVIQLARCSGNPAQQFRLNAAHDLVNPQADKCVDVRDRGTGNGNRLQLWDCNGMGHQKWGSA
ncbi:ricin-type beta-trefoil lectin domain protein, partial [Streptomyces sp. NPDC002491]